MLINIKSLAPQPWSSPLMSHILTSADVLSIPSICVNYKASANSLSGSIRAPLQANAVDFDPSEENWHRSPMAKVVSASGRTRILICGNWLEEAVTLVTLRALVSGVDVYLCVDAIGSINADLISTHLARLEQHNAVLTSAGQVVREWSALCGDDGLRAALTPIINEITSRSS